MSADTSSAPRDAAAETLWSRRFWRLLAGVFLLRVLVLALFPLNLVGDEAYYWEWGRRLDWGYYSKPPLIAWLMALADWLGGGTAFGIRIWAVLLGTGALLFTFLLARRMYGARAGFWAGALTVAMPAAAGLSLLLTIDPPLVFFWSASLYLFWRVAHDPVGSRVWPWAVLLALALGMGHLAKQMMMIFPLLALASLGRAGWRRLPVLLPTMLLSYLSLIPPLWWNYRHDWITFTHTGHHFAPDGLAKFPQNFGEFVGIELGMLSPVPFLFIFGLGVGGVFVIRRLAVRERFLVLFSGLPLLGMLLMTLRQGLLPNWPAVFFIAGTVLAAGWATGNAPGLPLPPRMRSWLKPGVWIGVGMTGLAICLLLVLSHTNIIRKAMVRLVGWDDLAVQVDTVRSVFGMQDRPIIVTGHRHNTSQLAFYLPDQPRVYHWPQYPGVLESQYEMWDDLDTLKGQEVLVLFDHEGKGEPTADNLAASLADARQLGSVAVQLTDERSRTFTVYTGRFLGLPEPASQDHPAPADAD